MQKQYARWGSVSECAVCEFRYAKSSRMTYCTGTDFEVCKPCTLHQLIFPRVPRGAAEAKQRVKMADSGDAGLYKWSDEDTRELIRWRVANEALFTGKRNAAVRGFEAFVLEKNLKGKVTPVFVKKKWENLKQKYKELRCPPTGVSTEGGEATAASWKWYTAMDEAIGGRPSISPPTLIASSGQGAAEASTPSCRPGDSQTPGRKRQRETDLIVFLKEMEERENEREREAAEREERRWQEAEEREERRERERIEREERREQETREREERRDREAREREERRETEARIREERRDREEREREERFLQILGILVKK
ncbi:ensconsin-like [Astyanax mexicanus]|nr:ensconsin [Astyanax mexicanus]XP_049342320.1 ensconsin-like [Astyanax mexicanus]